MRKKLLISGLICLLIFCQIPTYAYAYTDDQYAEKYPIATSLSHDSYSLEDLAAARLAAYDFLPEDYQIPQEETNQPISRLESIALLYKAFGQQCQSSCPFTDVPAEYEEAVVWAYQNGLISDNEKDLFGDQDVSQSDFMGMIQGLLGDEINEFDTSLYGGSHEVFSLGKAALLIQEILENSSLPNNIPEKIDQIPFPSKIRITLQSVEEAETMIRKTFAYIPHYIIMERGDGISEENFLELFKYYRELEYGITMSSDLDGSWIYSRIDNKTGMQVQYDCYSEDYAGEEALKEFENSAYIRDLLDSFWSEEIDSDEYTFKYDIARADSFGKHTTITLKNIYTQSWEMICDEDDVFCHFADPSVSSLADSTYQKNLSKLDGLSDYDTIMEIKKIVMNKASYAYVDGPSIHLLAEFFTSGRIVCDAYANAFQYFCTKQGIPCVVVYGVTSKNGQVDHAWNKVQIDGKWYNMDVCWADTGGGRRYDLKSDDYYTRNSHWPIVFMKGSTFASESYSE